MNQFTAIHNILIPIGRVIIGRITRLIPTGQTTIGGLQPLCSVQLTLTYLRLFFKGKMKIKALCTQCGNAVGVQQDEKFISISACKQCGVAVIVVWEEYNAT